MASADAVQEVSGNRVRSTSGTQSRNETSRSCSSVIGLCVTDASVPEHVVRDAPNSDEGGYHVGDENQVDPPAPQPARPRCGRIA